jgi:hypothetical protein
MGVSDLGIRLEEYLCKFRFNAAPDCTDSRLQYFLVAFSAIGVVAFIFFPDSWRQERSAVYQAAKQQALDRARRRRLVKDESPCHPRCESAGSLTRTKGSQQSYSGGGLAVQEKTSEPPKATRLKKLFDYRPLSVKEGDLSVKIGIREFNVFPLIWDISRLPHNALVLLASGKTTRIHMDRSLRVFFSQVFFSVRNMLCFSQHQRPLLRECPAYVPCIRTVDHHR